MESIMNAPITAMTDAESARVAAPAEGAGLGALRTERGNLPLDRIDIRADITGLTARVELTQDFVNTFDVPLEATYVFPLPDRAAVTAMRMTADGRVIDAELQERGAARRAYAVVPQIQYEGSHYRRDIGYRQLRRDGVV